MTRPTSARQLAAEGPTCLTHRNSRASTDDPFLPGQARPPQLRQPRVPGLLAVTPTSSEPTLRLHVGVIGAGGMGSSHIGSLKKLRQQDNLQPVAVADCWKSRAESGAKNMEADQAFTDYRKLLDIKEIDYVTIATPEHWHCDMTIDAHGRRQGGLLRKADDAPDSRSTGGREEAERDRACPSRSASRPCPTTATLGRQGDPAMACWARSSRRRSSTFGDTTSKAHGETRTSMTTRPQPADLNWNAWLGHAPKFAWNPHHYFEWRNYSRYSGGICTDLFIHRITRIMKACDLLYPRRVVGMGGIWQWPDGRDLPDNFEMICEYPRGMTVYVLGTMSNRVGIDHLIRGYRGTITSPAAGWVAKDKDGKVLAEHKKTGGEDIDLHHTNLHNHLRNGEQLNCPVDLGMAGVVAVNMANESWRTGQMMGWDKENEKMVPAHTLPEQNYFPEEQT